MTPTKRIVPEGIGVGFSSDYVCAVMVATQVSCCSPDLLIIVVPSDVLILNLTLFVEPGSKAVIVGRR